jgi:hypothetical protein
VSMSTSEPGPGEAISNSWSSSAVQSAGITSHLCCAIDADRENSRVPAHVGELDPQHITRFGAAPSARNLVGPASAWTRRTAGLSLPAVHPAKT